MALRAVQLFTTIHVASSASTTKALASLLPAVINVNESAIGASSLLRYRTEVHVLDANVTNVDWALRIEEPSADGWAITAMVLTGIAACVLLFDIMSCTSMCCSGTPQEGKDELPDSDTASTVLEGGRHRTLILMLLINIGADLYNSMPSVFFAGEAEALGVPLAYVGFYLGAAPLAATFAAPLSPYLLGASSPNELLSIAVLLLAVAAIPQGLANYLSSGGFIGLTLPLRLLEGIVMGISDTTIMAVVLRIYPPQDVSAAVGVLSMARSISLTASPFVGGALYAAAGMTAPYLVLGVLNIVTVLLLKLFMKELPSHPQDSHGFSSCLKLSQAVSLLKLWRLDVAAFSYFTMFLISSAVSSMAQVWLGSPPLSLEVIDVSYVLLASLASMFFGGIPIGVYLTQKYGPVIPAYLGHAFAISGLALIISFPTRHLTLGIAYLAMCLTSSGIGISLAAVSPLMLLSVSEAGLSQAETSGPQGALQVMLPYLACFIGPYSATSTGKVSIHFTFVVLLVMLCLSLMASLVAHVSWCGKALPSATPSPEEHEGEDPSTVGSSDGPGK